MGTVRTKVIRGKTLPWYVRNKTKFSLHDGPALLEEAIKKGEVVLPWEKEQAKGVKGFFRDISTDQKDELPERIARISVAELGCQPTMPRGQNYELREIFHRADLKWLKLCSDFVPLEMCFGGGFWRATRGESLAILTKPRLVYGVLSLVRATQLVTRDEIGREKRKLQLSVVDGYPATLFRLKDEFLISVV